MGFAPGFVAPVRLVVRELSGAESDDRVVEERLVPLSEQASTRFTRPSRVFLGVVDARHPEEERLRKQRDRREGHRQNGNCHARPDPPHLKQQHEKHQHQTDGAAPALAEDDRRGDRRHADDGQRPDQRSPSNQRKGNGQRQKRHHVQRHVVGIAEQSAHGAPHPAVFVQIDPRT